MTKREDVKALLWLLLYSFVLLFFLSSDSFLYDLYYHYDSSAFFMCGKAWMNGMVPYVDFADSKGPLLWLIYGLGYLISHHSYIGVFWISILFYTATLFTAYKLCRLFADKVVASVSVAVLPLFLFCFLLYGDVKAEDFCYPFVMFSLYCTCRILKYRDSDSRTYFKLSTLMGVCSMCCVLIKYNIGCMIMTLMAVVLYMAIRHKAGWKSFWGMVLGFVALAVPFLIYFIFWGNMEAFIHEYFVNTFLTIINKGTRSVTTRNIRIMVGAGILLCILIIGIYNISKKHKLGYWLIPCLLLFYIGLGRPYGGGYYLITMPFAIFIIMIIVGSVLIKFPYLYKTNKVLCFIIVLVNITININCIHKTLVYEGARDDYYRTAYVMSQIRKPTVFGYNCLDMCVGLPAGTLPACRYWIPQSGLTDEMRKGREENIVKAVPDFMLISCPNNNNEVLKYEEAVKRIESLGYVFYCYAPIPVTKMRSNKPHKVSLYGRPGLRLPPEDFHVSQWDVWLKRNIFGI